MSTRYNNGSHYENHQRAAELHDVAAHAHRVAEQGKHRHQTGHEHSRQALEHSQEAHHYTQAAASAPRVQPFSHDELAKLAYELWQARGRPDGSSEEDWFHAAEELRGRTYGPLTQSSS